MKPLLRIILTGIALLILPITRAQDKDAFRVWTSSAGTTVTAKLLSFASDRVKLQREDGSVLDVAIQQLSAEDQQFVRFVTAPVAAPARVRQKPEHPGELLQIRALKNLPPPTDASEAEVRRYIRRVLVFATDLDVNDQLGRRELNLVISGLGPSNLDILLDEINRVITGRSGMGSPLVPLGISFSIEPALVELATEDNKALVLSAFAKNISLAGLVKQKPWDADAADALISLLKAYQPYGGWGRQDIDFFALAGRSKDPRVRDALVALLSRPRTEHLINLAVRPFNGEKPSPELIRQLWQKQRGGSRPAISLAATAMEYGEPGALEMTAKYLRTFSDSAAKNADYESRQAKEFARSMTRLTGAPAGSPAEVANWVLPRLDKLKWDPLSQTYVE